ncbi:hypothetical protein BV20DRAFT_1034933 [Pilatotrama ljubarskyi]|nr:hypothetical protein BV20DRAFT_1034933 [Pilatotrama ljubarskyi]
MPLQSLQERSAQEAAPTNDEYAPQAHRRQDMPRPQTALPRTPGHSGALQGNAKCSAARDERGTVGGVQDVAVGAALSPAGEDANTDLEPRTPSFDFEPEEHDSGYAEALNSAELVSDVHLGPADYGDDSNSQSEALNKAGNWNYGSDASGRLSEASRRQSTVEDCEEVDCRDSDSDNRAAAAWHVGTEDWSWDANGNNDHSAEDDRFEVADDDPLYASLEDLYGEGPASERLDPSEPRTTAGELAPAFREHPMVCHAYVEAFVAVAFNGATHDLASYMLVCARARLASITRWTGYEIPGLATMAVTLRTAERRLGINPDNHITYYVLCDICWAHHHPHVLKDLPHNGRCLDADCPGTLFTTKQLSDGRRRRIPVKVLSATSPKASIQRMLLRPGKLSELNLWRHSEDDGPRDKPLISAEDWMGYRDDNYRMYDMSDGWGWRTIQAGLSRRQGGPWGVTDVDVHESNQCFVALQNGLVLIFNLDWFRALKRGNYSVGAIYLTVCNNPRSKRFLREETFLLAVIPGPNEPSLEQLNSVLDIFVPELLELYNGVDMRVPDEEEPTPVHCYLRANTSDLPAARKASGLRGHTSKWFMCPVCKQPLHSLADPDCFDPEKLSYRDKARFLKYAFRARDADADVREEIAEERGVRWSSLNVLPGWLPVTNTPTEFMHAGFLGEAKHVVQGILVAGGMLVKRSRSDNPLKKLEAWVDACWWPASAGRVPKGLLIGGSGKADQWHNMVAILPPALYEAWQVSGDIPDEEAPPLRPKQKAAIKAKQIAAIVRERWQAAASYNIGTTAEDLEYIEQSSMQRNYIAHFETVLEWCTAMRIWASQSITVAEAHRAQDCHDRACQSWAVMVCHLTPYFHLMVHFNVFLFCLGTVYAWWAYVYERFNGWLSKINHNGHKGGELEATMMRSWVKLHLIHDLIIHLEGLEPDRSQEDEDSIADLKKCLAGEKRPAHNRGTLLSTIAAMTAKDSGELMKFPSHSQKRNLRAENIYTLVFQHLREAWKDQVRLVPDTSFAEDGSPFIALAVPFYSHVLVAGQRYGASTMHRGIGHRYAYVDGRQAVNILHLLHCEHWTTSGKTLCAELAVVLPLTSSNAAAEMPWASRAADLGIDVWKFRSFGSPRVVDVRQFSGHFALNTITYKETTLTVTMSLCHDSQEPDQLDESMFDGLAQ